MEMIKETAKVVRQQQIDEGIFDMELSFPKGAALAKPGQFIAMYCNDKSKLLPRPISICGINKEEGTLRVVYRVAGEGTKEFSEMKEGDTLEGNLCLWTNANVKSSRSLCRRTRNGSTNFLRRENGMWNWRLSWLYLQDKGKRPSHKRKQYPNL